MDGPWEQYQQAEQGPWTQYSVADVTDTQSAPVTATGLAKAAGVGAAKGAIGLGGMIGDLSNLGAKGLEYATNYASDKLGVPRYERPQGPSMLDNLPTSDSIQKKVESYTGEFRKPQNAAESIAQTAGEFLPLAAMGPGGIVRKGLTNVVAPTVGSETAGALTKGTEAEPYARAAGAIIAGGAASKLGNVMDSAASAKATQVSAPSIGELKDAARAQYNHPEVKAVEIKPQAAVSLRDTIKTDLEGQGFRKANQAPVFNTIDELANPVGATVKVADIDSTRKALGKLALEKDVTGTPTATATAASKAIDHINDFLPNLNQTNLVAGDAAKANAILNDARGNWGAAKRSETVQTKLSNAELQAASTYGGGNINNATRQALRPLLKNNAAQTGGYSPEALSALNHAVKGDFISNTMRSIGKLAPSGPVGVGLHIGAGIGSGGASLSALPVTMLAKKLGNSMTRNAVGRVDTALRSDSPLAKLNNPQTIAQLKKSDSPIAAALLRAIIAAQSQPTLPMRFETPSVRR